MRIAVILLLTLLGSSSFASRERVELATVMGTPSDIVAGDIIHDSVRLVPDAPFDIGSTFAFSILKQEGISKVFSVEAIVDGTTSWEDYEDALEIAAHEARVVLSIIGPVTDSICYLMASYPETAFVVVAGNDHERRDGRDEPNCLAPNILMVAALDQHSGVLLPFANWGDLVRLAAPGHEVVVEDIDGQLVHSTGTTVAASLVAANLAHYAKDYDFFSGAELVDNFIFDEGEFLPGLVGKVRNARALRWSEDLTK